MFMLTGRKLALTLAFTVLVVVAFGMSCNGFFTDPVLQSIAIQPASPQIQIGSSTTQTLQAWGTYDTKPRSLITSGVSWTSSPSTIVEIIGTCANAQSCGSATVQGVASGTATITAAAQGLSTTATATAYLANITNFEACQGTTVPVTSCTSTWNPNAAGTVTQPFVAQGTSNGTTFDLTTAATWTVAPTPAAGSITCTNNGGSPETCTVEANTTAGPYTITVTYGANPTLTATVSVTVTN
jgi:hypothetical protein